MLSTNLPLMKRSIYHPAIECSCGLHTWPTLLQSVCKCKDLHKCLHYSYPTWDLLCILQMPGTVIL